MTLLAFAAGVAAGVVFKDKIVSAYESLKAKFVTPVPVTKDDASVSVSSDVSK